MERNNFLKKKKSPSFCGLFVCLFSNKERNETFEKERKHTKNVSELSYKLEETSNMWRDKVPRRELVPAS